MIPVKPESKLKMFVAIPTTGTNCDAQVYALRTMEKNYADRVEFVYPQDCIRRIFHDYARNEMVDEFLKTDCDFIWFLDSDVAPMTNVLDLFLAYVEEWDVGGAPYPLFISQKSEESPQVVYAVYNGTSGKGMRPSDVPMTGSGMVDGLATGCLFIKRHIFEKLQKPYFEFKYNTETRELIEGEDLGFCKKVGALGYKFLVDYSKPCKHYKMVCLRDVNDYAMTYAKRQVEAYDAMIRGKMQALNEKLRAKRAVPKILSPHDVRFTGITKR